MSRSRSGAWGVALVWLLAGCQSKPREDVESKTPNETGDNPRATSSAGGSLGTSTDDTAVVDSVSAGMTSVPGPSDSAGTDLTAVLDTAVVDAAVFTPIPVESPPAAAPEDVPALEERFDYWESCVERYCSTVVTEEAQDDDASSNPRLASGPLRCVLETLAQPQAGTFAYRTQEGDSTLEIVLYVHPVRLAQVITRRTSGAGEVSIGIQLFCGLAPVEFFQHCLSELPEGDASVMVSPECSSPTGWLTSCVPDDSPAGGVCVPPRR